MSRTVSKTFRRFVLPLVAMALSRQLTAQERSASAAQDRPARGAEAPSDPEAASPQPSEEMILFQDIPEVSGASKYEQKESEAPASVSVVTSDEIRKYGYRTLADILSSVRGFFTTYDRNYSYVGVRGFGRPGDYNTRILLLVDGHRINDNIYDSAYIGTESVIDVQAIDRVEIIRGPSSSLYGTNAFLAVVDVITKRGRDQKGSEMSAESASHDSYKGRLSHGSRFNNGLDVLLAASYSNSRGQRLFFPEFDGSATNNGWTGHLDGDRFENLFSKISFGNYSLEASFNSRRKGIPTASFGTIFNDPRTGTLDRRAFLAVKYQKDLADSSRLATTLSYDYYRYEGAYAYPASLFRDYGYGQWWGVETQYIRPLGSRHKVVVGEEYRYNAQQDQGGFDIDPYYSYLKDRRRSRIWAAYAQDEFRINDRLIVNAGVRYDDYDTFGGTTNPRVAVIYAMTRDATLKLLYGRAFRAPNAYEMFYNDGGYSQKANPALRPETIGTYEIALEHPLGSRARAAGSLYHYAIHDLITQEADKADGLFIYENVDRVGADGAEVEIEGRLARLDGRLSYARQRSRNALTGEALTNSPEHLAKAHLAAPLWSDAVSAGLEILFSSRNKTLSGGHAAGYSVANLTLLGRIGKRGPEISASIYNLLDRRYGYPGSEQHVQDVIFQDGRNYRAGLKYEF